RTFNIMMRYLLSIPLFFITTVVLAQSGADTTGMSPLKTMSYVQYKAYIDGIDQFNLAGVASLNHYAEPQKALNWKRELDLSVVQVTDITSINSTLVRKMKEMGDFIVKNERALDEMFRTKKVTDGTLIFYTNRYGLYQGEMRNAVLQAAVKVQAILTPAQRKKYEQLQKLNH
ncbi:MAG: Spy/CpxP family protein refolding chaperone, partial [Mucilaginibacter sp.]|uniref:Spy/CpxP family protein refolding chaperone n=1 Tax=Mucilaginibacter sp. TaxID=1882438 RepID=UPI0032634DA9